MTAASLSRDGRTMIFTSIRTGACLQDLWMTSAGQGCSHDGDSRTLVAVVLCVGHRMCNRSRSKHYREPRRRLHIALLYLAEPANLGSMINTTFNEQGPTLSNDE